MGHWPIGFHCGYSKSGSPVKIERLGACAPPSDTKLLYPYYLALVDTLQRRLDRTSVTSGRLQQTYELFDLAGLGTCSLVDFTTPPCPRHVLDTPCACPAGTHMVTFTTLSFTKATPGRHPALSLPPPAPPPSPPPPPPPPLPPRPPPHPLPTRPPAPFLGTGEDLPRPCQL